MYSIQTFSKTSGDSSANNEIFAKTFQIRKNFLVSIADALTGFLWLCNLYKQIYRSLQCKNAIYVRYISQVIFNISLGINCFSPISISPIPACWAWLDLSEEHGCTTLKGRRNIAKGTIDPCIECFNSTSNVCSNFNAVDSFDFFTSCQWSIINSLKTDLSSSQQTSASKSCLTFSIKISGLALGKTSMSVWWTRQERQWADLGQKRSQKNQKILRSIKHHVSKQMSLHFETDERRHVQLFIIHTHAQMSIAVCGGGGGGGGCSGTDHRQCQVWWQCGGIHVEQVGWWLGNQNRWQWLGDWWWKFFFFRISPRSVLHLSFEALPPTLHTRGSWAIQRMSFF